MIVFVGVDVFMNVNVFWCVFGDDFYKVVKGVGLSFWCVNVNFFSWLSFVNVFLSFCCYVVVENFFEVVYC